jgi:hypothetical protein
MGGEHADPDHIRTMLDCAQICAASADFMLRGSKYHARTCAVCMEICAACAASCEEIDASDEAMQQCVEACRRCAASCRRMSGMTA